MRQIISAAAVLALLAPVAYADSNVTIFGALDLNARHIQYSGNGSVNSVGSFGGSPSLLGFRGTEDLGDGLKASFWLETAILPDTGDTAQSLGLPFWTRGSWVSLGSDAAGTLRLGRDWSASYFGQWEFDPTFNLGLGDHLHLTHVDGGFLWRNNTVQYITPGNLGGFSARLMFAPSEGGSAGSYRGGRAAFSGGPYNIAASYGSTSNSAGGDFKLAHLGTSYDFGATKVMLLLANSKHGDMSERRWALSSSVPIGNASLWASYSKVLVNSAANAGGWFGGNQLAVGGGYALSKRTGLYASISRLKNDPGGALSIEEVGSYTFASPGGSKTLSGGSNTGVEFGIRTAF